MRKAGEPGTGIPMLTRMCPPHRGWSWSHRPRFRATLGSWSKAKAAPEVLARWRGRRYGHYKGQGSPMDAPARSNTLSPRRYPGQATRIHLEGGAYLAGRRGPRVGLACLGVLERLRRDARGLRQLPAGQPALLSQAPHLLAVHHQIHHSFLLVCSLWQPPQTNVCSRVSLALVAPSLVVAAWLIGVGLSAIRAAAAEVERVLLRLLARLRVESDLAERYPAVITDVGGFALVMLGCCVE